MNYTDSIEALRNYLRTAPAEELQAHWDRVKAMNLGGPTLREYLQTQAAYASYLPLHTKFYDA